MTDNTTSVTGVLISIVWIVFIYWVIDSSFGYNPIKSQFKFKETIWTVIPQGWGFFTRNPRETRVDLYEYCDGHFHLVTMPNSSSIYHYGFNREMRIKGAELGFVTSETPQILWQSYFEESTFFAMPALEVTNPFGSPILCGDFLLKRTEVIPWAWFEHRDKLNMPTQYLRLKVDCYVSVLD